MVVGQVEAVLFNNFELYRSPGGKNRVLLIVSVLVEALLYLELPPFPGGKDHVFQVLVGQVEILLGVEEELGNGMRMLQSEMTAPLTCQERKSWRN